MCACADSILGGATLGDRDAHERAAHLVELTAIAIREALTAARELIARVEGVGGGGNGGGGAPH